MSIVTTDLVVPGVHRPSVPTFGDAPSFFFDGNYEIYLVSDDTLGSEDCVTQEVSSPGR